MTLVCALSAGLSLRRASALTACFHVSLRTLQRWQRWWLQDFVHTPFWRGHRALFLPPVAECHLPESLRSRFQAADEAGQWGLLLRFLTPLTSRTANMSAEGR